MERKDNQMLIRLGRQIERAASLGAVFVLFIFLLPFNLLLFPARGQRLEQYLGYKANVLDARLYYTPEQAYLYISDLNPPGRQLYALSELTLDLLYPLLYGSFLGLSLASIYSRLFPLGRFLPSLPLLSTQAAFSAAAPPLRCSPAPWLPCFLPLLPLAGALADLGENLIITVLLLAYPIALYWLVYLANLFTLLKWLAVLLSIFLILLGAGAYLLIRFNKRKDKLLSGE